MRLCLAGQKKLVVKQLRYLDFMVDKALKTFVSLCSDENEHFVPCEDEECQDMTIKILK